jgi:hypothetical protein
METMYPGFTNSPSTTLTGDITDVATTIPVAELSVFPAAPNLAVIGTGEDAETILYTGKSAVSGGGNLTGVTREIDKQTVGTTTTGEKLSWVTGDVIGRNFTHLDLYALQTNVASLSYDNTVEISPTSGDYNTIQAALDANATEYTLFLVYPGVYADDTIHFTANNQSVIGLDNSTTQIVGSTSTNIVDFSTFTGCVLNRVTARITGATDSCHTLVGSSGNIIVNDCTLSMTNASYTGAVQPTVIKIDGGGTCEVKFGYINYSNPVAQAGVIKAAIRIAAGCYVRLRRGDVQINGAGASAGTTLSLSAGSGRITATRTTVSITDTACDDVVGFYLNGTSLNDAVTNCDLTVIGGTNRATGIWNASTGTVISTANIITVTAPGGTAKSYINQGTLNTTFDIITAAGGHTNTGTLNAVNSPSPGNLYVTGTGVYVSDMNPKRLMAYDGITADANSAQLMQVDLATNKFPITYGIFQEGVLYQAIEKLCWETYTTDPDANEYTATIEWTHAAAVGTDVTWTIYAVRVADGATYDVTIPLVATITDTFSGVAYAKQLSSASAQFPITGTGGTILWMLKRSDAVTDTLIGDALFKSLTIDMV